jgi:lipopolysaccharide export LptBFGC system permease protein LptF
VGDHAWPAGLFAYLIVVRVSQSLGYKAIIPPIWAAWLPNGIFTLLGWDSCIKRKSEVEASS